MGSRDEKPSQPQGGWEEEEKSGGGRARVGGLRARDRRRRAARFARRPGRVDGSTPRGSVARFWGARAGAKKANARSDRGSATGARTPRVVFGENIRVGRGVRAARFAYLRGEHLVEGDGLALRGEAGDAVGAERDDADDAGHARDRGEDAGAAGGFLLGGPAREMRGGGAVARIRGGGDERRARVHRGYSSLSSEALKTEQRERHVEAVDVPATAAACASCRMAVARAAIESSSSTTTKRVRTTSGSLDSAKKMLHRSAKPAELFPKTNPRSRVRAVNPPVESIQSPADRESFILFVRTTRSIADR